MWTKRSKPSHAFWAMYVVIHPGYFLFSSSPPNGWFCCRIPEFSVRQMEDARAASWRLCRSLGLRGAPRVPGAGSAAALPPGGAVRNRMRSPARDEDARGGGKGESSAWALATASCQNKCIGFQKGIIELSFQDFFLSWQEKRFWWEMIKIYFQYVSNTFELIVHYAKKCQLFFEAWKWYCSIVLVIKNHGMVLVDWTFKNYVIPVPLPLEGHHPLDQMAQSPI